MNENGSLTGKLLVVDGEPNVAQVLSEFLREEGHHVTVSYSGTEALRFIQESAYDVILTDLLLPDIATGDGGLRILEFAKKVDPSTETIIITGHATLHSIKQAIRLGAHDLIIKPADGTEVIQSVAEALVKRRIEEERDQVVREAEKARAEHKELFDLATRDGLTNLYNYRYLQTQLQSLMTQRAEKTPLSLVMIDMDNFKTYNDRYGHLEGDKILVSVADLLTANIRDTDVAARYGGDEFVLLLLGATKDQAVAFAQRCVSLIREYKFKGEDPIDKLTISAGVATYPEDATDRENIIKKADSEMYAAKRAGGNQVRAVGI